MKLSVVFRVTVATLFLMLPGYRAVRAVRTRNHHRIGTRRFAAPSFPVRKVTVTNLSTNVVRHGCYQRGGRIHHAQPCRRAPYNVRVEKEGFNVRGGTRTSRWTPRTPCAPTPRSTVGSSTQAIEVMASAVQLQTEDAKTSITMQNKLVERPAAGGRRHRAHSVRSGVASRPKRRTSAATTASCSAADRRPPTAPRSTASRPTPAARFRRAGSRPTRPRSKPSTSSPWTPTGYKAEYGHAGGGIMTFVSKSGTNQFHGSAYEFLRNNDFDANNCFSNRAGIPSSIYKQNDFGFTVGGPVWIPKIYHGKDKTFFFFSYEGFRNRNGANGVDCSPFRRRKCTTAISASGSLRPACRFRSTIRLPRCTNADGTVHPRSLSGQPDSQEPLQRRLDQGPGRLPGQRQRWRPTTAPLRARSAT